MGMQLVQTESVVPGAFKQGTACRLLRAAYGELQR